ncbi:hypothetical protein SSP35_06_01570 [Streptomyces sp. NBRC 110611]|nr:hypothetical protein SSP35_06_01570 [Streptomyces sp. NBRC 110611]
MLREHHHELVGVTCLARGSDTLFAEAVVEAGGRLVVILPSRDYREAKVKPWWRSGTACPLPGREGARPTPSRRHASPACR